VRRRSRSRAACSCVLRFCARAVRRRDTPVGSRGAVPLAGPTPHRQLGLWLGVGGASFTASVDPNQTAPLPSGSGIAASSVDFVDAKRHNRARQGESHADTVRRACKNASVSRGSEFDQTVALRAPQPDTTDLGPISPELALVDPVLAERARRRLPDPRERPPLRRTTVGAVRPRTPAVQRRPRPAPRPRAPRWKRTVVLSALVFAAGAASTQLLERGSPTSPPLLLERAGTAGPTVSEKSTQRRRSGTHATRREATRRSRERGTRAKARTGSRAQRSDAAVKWSANVLGVSADVSSRGVRLAWKPPAGSDGVVVFRKLRDAKHSVTVFRGRANGVRDVSPRPCSSYRYTIVSYDRAGRPSTGVPTSVVTAGCA
jgi:hypothetical protein